MVFGISVVVFRMMRVHALPGLGSRVQDLGLGCRI